MTAIAQFTAPRALALINGPCQSANATIDTVKNVMKMVIFAAMPRTLALKDRDSFHKAEKNAQSAAYTITAAPILTVLQILNPTLNQTLLDIRPSHSQTFENMQTKIIHNLDQIEHDEQNPLSARFVTFYHKEIKTRFFIACEILIVAVELLFSTLVGACALLSAVFLRGRCEAVNKLALLGIGQFSLTPIIITGLVLKLLRPNLCKNPLSFSSQSNTL